AVGALSLAYPAGDAAVLIAHHLISGIEEINCHYALPPSRVKITGSPPRGAHTLVTCGSTRRMAHSSLATYAMSSVSATTMERSFSRSFRAIMPFSKPTRMEKGPVISREEKRLR